MFSSLRNGYEKGEESRCKSKLFFFLLEMFNLKNGMVGKKK